jgi:hypothetical protein
MLSNFSPQYSPLMSQFPGLFPGLQAAGWPQSSAYGGGGIAPFSGLAPFGHELGQPGIGQQTNPFVNPHSPAQQIVQVLAQLAQQISVQSALIQQVSFALQQLAHQLAVQGLQPGQLFAQGGPFATQGGYGQGQGGYGQGGYGGFTQGQPNAWGANRAQTIQ